MFALTKASVILVFVDVISHSNTQIFPQNNLDLGNLRPTDQHVSGETSFRWANNVLLYQQFVHIVSLVFRFPFFERQPINIYWCGEMFPLIQMQKIPAGYQQFSIWCIKSTSAFVAASSLQFDLSQQKHPVVVCGYFMRFSGNFK